MKTLPIDRSRVFRPSDYPRDPNEYVPMVHFGQRFKEQERFLDGDVIEATLKEGDIRSNGDGCACFRKVWGEGVAYYIIAGHHEKGYRVLVTGWPHLHHRRSALESGRWSPSELDQIEELNERYKERFEDKYPVYSTWLKPRS